MVPSSDSDHKRDRQPDQHDPECELQPIRGDPVGEPPAEADAPEVRGRERHEQRRDDRVPQQVVDRGKQRGEDDDDLRDRDRHEHRYADQNERGGRQRGAADPQEAAKAADYEPETGKRREVSTAPSEVEPRLEVAVLPVDDVPADDREQRGEHDSVRAPREVGVGPDAEPRADGGGGADRARDRPVDLARPRVDGAAEHRTDGEDRACGTRHLVARERRQEVESSDDEDPAGTDRGDDHAAEKGKREQGDQHLEGDDHESRGRVADSVG